MNRTPGGKVSEEHGVVNLCLELVGGRVSGIGLLENTGVEIPANVGVLEAALK